MQGHQQSSHKCSAAQPRQLRSLQVVGGGTGVGDVGGGTGLGGGEVGGGGEAGAGEAGTGEGGVQTLGSGVTMALGYVAPFCSRASIQGLVATPKNGCEGSTCRSFWGCTIKSVLV